MKLKALAAATALTLVSGAALAQDYQFEVGGSYTNTDPDAGNSDGSVGAYGEYYFQPVRVGQNPLREAAFINRASNVFVNGSDDLDVIEGGVEFYIPDTIFYAAAEIVRTDYDETNNDWGVRLGVTPITGLLLWTEYFDEPGYDANINAKYVMPLGGGTFLNMEGGYADHDETNEYSAYADYYFDQTFSVGAGYFDNDYEDGFTLRTEKFFTPEISGQLSYTSADSYDSITVGASFRF